MAFNKIDLDNIKSKIQISTEIEKKTKLIKKGKDLWCCCPFHNEKTPSCKINDDLGTFYCFGCGAKGDIFTIYQDLFNYTFLDAVKELAERVGVKINLEKSNFNKKNNNILKILEISTQWFEDNLHKEGKECLAYLDKRSITQQTIKKFRLGYSYNSKNSLYNYLKKFSFENDEILKSNLVKKDKNNNYKDFFYKRLMFPIINLQGKVVGFGGRVLDNSNPKYINSPESNFFIKRSMLYNLNLAKDFARQKNNILICEGYMDVISLYQNNIKSVVAPLGTSFTEDQLKLSWRYVDKPTIMFDGDAAGKRASYKVALMTLQHLNSKKFMQFIKLPEQMDPDSYLKKYSFNDLKQTLKKPIPLINFIFNESIETVDLNNADNKIIFDKYLDDLIITIKDKKVKYFYKNEFKNLFFNSLREKKSSVVKSNNLLSLNQLNEKQILSFFSALLNHVSIRLEILNLLESSMLLNSEQIKLVKLLKLEENLKSNYRDLFINADFKDYSHILKKTQEKSIFQLFPYANIKFNSQKTYIEVKESIKNLNRRLSNLQKINKSLDEFDNNSSSLSWEELLKISQEMHSNLNKE